MTVTVVGRGVSSVGMELRRVEDLVPYWEGRAELLSALAAARTYERPEEMDLPPAVGLEAPRALVEAVLVEGAWLSRELRRRRPPSPRRRPVLDLARLWEASTRAQMQLARQPREQAKQSVTAMVNQLVSLVEKTEWFGDVALRQAAIDETLAYWVLGRKASSGSAQRAWQRLWEAMQRPPEVTGDTPGIDDLATFRAHSETVGGLERTWLEAWRQWADTPAIRTSADAESNALSYRRARVARPCRSPSSSGLPRCGRCHRSERDRRPWITFPTGEAHTSTPRSLDRAEHWPNTIGT
ncbi:MAG TPA: hypothetical protein ENH00_07160 [Actinobacteria bacterium]|nr:hypothetical protein [Actinomycetota bacterium]